CGALPLEGDAAAVENVGPGDDGSGSLADTSSLSEDAAGSLTDSGASSRDAPANGLRSEEGLQVCQETVAESGHSFTPPSPTLLSPSPTSHVPLLSNLESYSLASADLDSNTGISLQAGGQTPLGPTVNTNPEAYTDICPPESHIPVGPYPESSITVPAPMREEEGGRPQEQSELAKKVAEVGKQADSPYDSELGEVRGAEGDRLRKRKVRPLGPLDKTEKQADEDEDEEEEYRPIQQVEEHGGFSLNKCAVPTGVFVDLEDDDDVEVRELKDPEVPLSQDWVNRDMEAMRVQEMAQLLDKLAQENQQIAVLQAQLQSQAEELNLALQRAEEGGKEFVRKEELEKENEQMRMELSSLPSLQRELETLRARNSSQSTGVEKAASMEGEDHQRDRLTEELERQKVLLQESRKRLEEMKVENGGKKGVREGLVEVERRLTEEVEKLGQRREAKRKERHGGRKWEGQGDRDVMKKWEEGKKERHWKSTADKKPLDAAHRHHEHNDYWKGKKQKLQHYYRAPVNCSDIAACAKQEGLVPVQLADFEGLLASYLEKLGEAESKSKEEIGTLVRDFFVDGVFSHDRISFRDFVEDLADILEDIVEAGGNEELEDEMEEFEREALRKFVLDGGEEKRGDWKRGNG
ncbi:hypothetical protein Z043_109317, partial [Scleropages formosus]